MSEDAPVSSQPARPGIKPELDPFAVAILTSLCICLAVGHAAIKFASDGISPLLQAGLRSFGGAALLAIVAWLRGVRLFVGDGTFAPALLVSGLFAAEFAFLYPGLKLTTASHAVILLYTAPFVVAVGAHFMIAGDRMTSPKLAGLAMALAGVALVVLGKDAATGTSRGPSLIGDLMCLAAALAWGALTLAIRTTSLAKADPLRVTFLQLLISAPLLCALSVALDEPGLMSPTPMMWAALAFTVIFVAGYVFTTTTWLFTRYPASRVMAFLLLTPVFGVVAAHILLGDALGPNLLAGLALVLAGLWLVNRPAGR